MVEGMHCTCASREGLVRWIKQNLDWIDRKGVKFLFCRTQGSAGCNTLLCHLIVKGRCTYLFCTTESCNKPIHTFPLHTGTVTELGPLSAFLIHDCVQLSSVAVSANSKTWLGGSVGQDSFLLGEVSPPQCDWTAQVWLGTGMVSWEHL